MAGKWTIEETPEPGKWVIEEAPSPPKPGFGERMNANIEGIPRQLGLTGRHIIEGLGETANFIASPVRGALNLVTPEENKFKPYDFPGIADFLGLPKPETAIERGTADASRVLAGGGGIIGGAGKLATVTNGATKAVATALSANPALQLSSAGGSGAAGGYVKETGGNEASQLLASVVGGLATPYAASKAQQLATATKNLVGAGANNVQNVDIRIQNALNQNGITLDQLPNNIRAGIRNDVAQALKADKGLSGDAVRRLVDYRLTNTTPTAATLSLDPVAVTQQKNLAKLGANVKDPAAQQLAQVENSNNRQLIAGLNDLGANTADDAIAGGNKIIGALDARNTRAKTLINGRYEAARATDGRSAGLDPHAFTNKANDLLDESLLGGKLPADVRTLLNNAATGKLPLTVDTAEQFKTRIGELQRASSDAAERRALGLVRQSLDDTPLLNGGAGLGQESINAFNRARRLNRSYMGIVDRTPALQSVRDGIEPDKFVNQFIIGGSAKSNLADVQALKSSIKSNPQAMTAVKEQIVSHLKGKALNGAADEVGNISQSAYNKALQSIGDRKLALFFTKAEHDQLKAIGRVAGYEQFQPRGSAVNNSNSASAIGSILDRIGGSPLLRKIPFGSSLAEPVQNISIGIGSKRALDIQNGLKGGGLLAPKRDPRLLFSPAGLLTLQEE